jgi:hypothetical protein
MRPRIQSRLHIRKSAQAITTNRIPARTLVKPRRRSTRCCNRSAFPDAASAVLLCRDCPSSRSARRHRSDRALLSVPSARGQTGRTRDSAGAERMDRGTMAGWRSRKIGPRREIGVRLLARGIGGTHHFADVFPTYATSGNSGRSARSDDRIAWRTCCGAFSASAKARRRWSSSRSALRLGCPGTPWSFVSTLSKACPSELVRRGDIATVLAGPPI